MDKTGKDRPATAAVKASKPRPVPDKLGKPRPFSDEFGGPEFHCETCCPWYPEPCCSGEFSAEFGAAMQGNCQHPSCITADHCVGDLLDHGPDYPYECLPWKADTSCDDGWDSLDEDLQKRALTLAWNTMSSLTGGRIASGCTTLRPCLKQDRCNDCMIPQPDGFGTPGGLLNPILWYGQWYNQMTCEPDCSCCQICELVMPGPVAALLEVNIDGYRHDPRLFRLDNGNRLVRQDGCCWPGCQNMGAPYGYYGTFGIKYVAGSRVDASGRWAVGVLAAEFAKACQGGKCRLPAAVTSIARQGVTMEFPRAMFAEGTGIREVDAYVFSINPNGLRTTPKVWSPDMQSQKHRITTGGPTGIWP